MIMTATHPAPPPSADIGDERILHMLQTHHPAAPGELVACFGERVHKLALRILGSEEDAKDAELETFVTVLKKWPTFQQRSKFSSWVHQVARNQALGMLRQQKRGRAVISLDDELAPASTTEREGANLKVGDTLGEDSLTPARLLEQCELRVHLHSAIAALPVLYRHVYYLREVEGLSLHEVARRTGVSEPAVKTRVHRARGLLRRKLQTVVTN